MRNIVKEYPVVVAAPDSGSAWLGWICGCGGCGSSDGFVTDVVVVRIVVVVLMVVVVVVSSGSGQKISIFARADLKIY